MQIKNKISLLIICFLSTFLLNLSVCAEEFNISALEIFVDKENDIVEGKGSVEAFDTEGRLIKADKVIYIKSKELLLAKGMVEVLDLDGNRITKVKIVKN